MVIPVRLLFANKHSHHTALRIGGAKFKYIMTAIQPMKNQLIACGGIFHTIDVLLIWTYIDRANVCRRIAIRISAKCLDIQHRESNNWIGIAWLWIAFCFDFWPQFRQPRQNGVQRDLRIIKAIKRQLFTGGTPPHARGLIEFFAVNPACCSISQSACSICRHRTLRSVITFQEEISVARFCAHRLVCRKCNRLLSSTRWRHRFFTRWSRSTCCWSIVITFYCWSDCTSGQIDNRPRASLAKPHLILCDVPAHISNCA